MAMTPEQKLADVCDVLIIIKDNAGAVTSPADLFADTSLTDSMRRDIAKKLSAAGFMEKVGAGRSTRYILIDEDSADLRAELDELIDDPEALSAFLWPRFEGHMGRTGSDDAEIAEEFLEPEETSDEPVKGGDAQTVLLQSIATNLAGLTDLVAAVFTATTEGGGRSIDLTPFVKSYTSLTERVVSMEKKIANIQEGLGLTNGTEEEPRGSNRGVQDEPEDDGEGKSVS